MAANNKTRTMVVGDSATSRAVYKEIGKDVYFYVSGSKNNKHNGLNKKNGDGLNGENERRVAVFGGDVVISGSLKVEGGELEGSFNFDCDYLELTGSLEVQGAGQFTDGVATSEITTVSGDPFFVAGGGIALESNVITGQVTIAQNIQWNEKLTGTADGMNLTFTTAHAPSSTEAIMVFINGILQEDGSDFTVSGNSITFNSPPQAGSKIVATYSK